MPAGRPTKYKPEYCEIAEATLAEGFSQAVLKEDLNEVVVIGIRRDVGEDGEKLWISGSEPKAERVIWLMNAAAFYLSKALSEAEM